MRRAEGKNLGYVILPVVIPANVRPEDALDDNERYKVVWQILNALRAHDPRLEGVINAEALNEDKIEVIVVADNLPQSRLRIILMVEKRPLPTTKPPSTRADKIYF